MQNNQELQTGIQNASKWKPAIYAAELVVKSKNGFATLSEKNMRSK